MSNTKTVSQKINEKWVHTWDMTAVNAAIGSTVSSVVWAIKTGTTVTLGTETLVDALASAVVISGSTPGRNCITATVTFADGQIGVYTLNINVNNPRG